MLRAAQVKPLSFLLPGSSAMACALQAWIGRDGTLIRASVMR